MKKFFLLCFALIAVGLNAQDTLSFDGIKAEIAHYQLSKPMMLKNPNVKRLFLKLENGKFEKHVEFEIIENKLFVSAITAAGEKISASPLLGKDAQFPVFCNWFTGKLHVSVDDDFKLEMGENKIEFRKNNFLFEIENGEIKSASKALYMGKIDKCRSIEDLQRVGIFSLKEKDSNDWIDARIVYKPSQGTQAEWIAISNGEEFKTRGILSIDASKRVFLYIPQTVFSDAIYMRLLDHSRHDISEFKNGDFVEIKASYAGRYNLYLYYMRKLSDTESIHKDNYFLHTLWNPTLKEFR